MPEKKVEVTYKARKGTLEIDDLTLVAGERTEVPESVAERLKADPNANVTVHTTKED